MEKFQYENNTLYSKKVVMDYIKFQNRHSQRNTIYCVFIIIFTLVGSTMLAYKLNMILSLIFCGLGLIVLPTLYITLTNIRFNKLYKKSIENDQELTCKYVFSDKIYYTMSNEKEKTCKYKNVILAEEYCSIIILDTDVNETFVLDKNGFTNGVDETFLTQIKKLANIKSIEEQEIEEKNAKQKLDESDEIK